MSIVIKEVSNKKQFNAFIDLPYRLYKNHPYNVPPLRFDESATLNKEKNPAFDYCEAKYFLAYKGDRVVGRIAAILNHAFIEKWKENYMRFGWIDFEEDPEIAAALLGAVEDWAKEKEWMPFTDLWVLRILIPRECWLMVLINWVPWQLCTIIPIIQNI